MTNERYENQALALEKMLCEWHLAPEAECATALIEQAQFSQAALSRVQTHTKSLVQKIRQASRDRHGIDSFLAEYDLSSTEGAALMCLAEALLRIPDAATVDALIQDKIASGNWEQHLGESDSLFVNSTTWALMLAGKIVSPTDTSSTAWRMALKKGIARCGEPVIRNATRAAMRILGKQFVYAQTIEDALSCARKDGGLYSFDMLGEAALTQEDAMRYFKAYKNAILQLAKDATSDNPRENQSVSIKISALSPRYDYWQEGIKRQEWIERVMELAILAKRGRIGFTIDAEESDRLAISLDIVKTIFKSAELKDFEGFGLAVQAYQKRAPVVIDWLEALALSENTPISIRLVKGAYWDSEIKRAQELGLSDYPVFTRKITTDVSYLACAKKILQKPAGIFYPQFATHNAFTYAAIVELARDSRDYEFQRLHGMGEALYNNQLHRCRVYAPVGGYHYLLSYLVRRLLENGANTSFVNRIAHEQVPLEELAADPVAQLKALTQKSHPKIPIPPRLFGEHRLNSRGIALSNHMQEKQLATEIAIAKQKQFHAYPLPAIKDAPKGNVQPCLNPANLSHQIGTVTWTEISQADNALRIASEAQEGWDATSVQTRAHCLDKAADLFEQHMEELLALIILEAGKTRANAVSEIREAIDFCRYYANNARELMAQPTSLPGPTGETNELALHGRGVFVCISPWNFPLAIFIGQVVAALVSGNCVVAKPAEQTPLIAHRAVELLYQAGVPETVLHCLPGDGETLGAYLVSDLRTTGVIFTGSTETARRINQSLAHKLGPLPTLIAETGGQNVMIVDSSALPEQVVSDVIRSAFDSAGQRCSALRVLYIQKEVADTMVPMLVGAMNELRVDDPSLVTTDIGPVIDEAALARLLAHVRRMDKEAKRLAQTPLPSTLPPGHYFAPLAYEIHSIQQLPEEVFGPILHVIIYEQNKLDAVIDEINSTGYGLTFGVHSRIQSTIDAIVSRVQVGNVYVNRNMIGAVVGVQPFGGRGLSGTGPKAGGPHYLLRLCEERVVSTNTVAMGGNASLLSL